VTYKVKNTYDSPVISFFEWKMMNGNAKIWSTWSSNLRSRNKTLYS